MAEQKEFASVQEEREYLWKNKMGPVDGFYLPPRLLPGSPAWPDKIRDLRQMKLRDDDVILITYPKSGTHWLWEVINMLRRETSQPDTHTKVQTMMEFVATDVLNQQPSPRTLDTHLVPCLLPVDEIKSKRVKVVHVYRNPKDVAVSLFHMSRSFKTTSPIPNETFTEFQEFFFYGDKQIYGEYFNYMRQMHEFQQQNPEVPMLNLAYEDVKKDSVQCVKKLAQFLEVSADEELCEQIAEACSFDNMKKQAAVKANPVMSSEAPSPEQLKKMKASAPVIYRKGQIGDWKNYFTVAQNERADAHFAKETKDFPFTLTFE